MSVKDLIRDKSLLQLQEAIRGRKDLEKIFINCSKMISSLKKKTESLPSLAVAIKYHRDILDYDLIIDCILEAIEPLPARRPTPGQRKEWEDSIVKAEGV